LANRFKEKEIEIGKEIEKKYKINSTGTLYRSFKIWYHELINFFIFLLIGLILFFGILSIFNINVLEQYQNIIKISIVLISYLGIILGAYKGFESIKENSRYLSRLSKYIILLFQLILFGIYVLSCFYFKLHIIFFIGGYLTIFVQFFTNIVFIWIHNKKHPKVQINDNLIDKRVKNIIDWDELTKEFGSVKGQEIEKIIDENIQMIEQSNQKEE